MPALYQLCCLDCRQKKQVLNNQIPVNVMQWTRLHQPLLFTCDRTVKINSYESNGAKAGQAVKCGKRKPQLGTGEGRKQRREGLVPVETHQHCSPLA